jgi:hypothetical protein
MRFNKPLAGVAQLVEHLTCNQAVEGSIPFPSTTLKKNYLRKTAIQLEKIPY